MQKAPSLCRLPKSQAKGTGQNDPRYHPASRIFLQRASEMRFDIRALSAHNACGRHRLPENRRITCGPKRAEIHPDSRLRFFPPTCAAPVGISETHVNLGRLSAGGLPSLTEHALLLYTLIAFLLYNVYCLDPSPAHCNLVSILAIFRQKVKSYLFLFQ